MKTVIIKSFQLDLVYKTGSVEWPCFDLAIKLIAIIETKYKIITLPIQSKSVKAFVVKQVSEKKIRTVYNHDFKYATFTIFWLYLMLI